MYHIDVKKELKELERLIGETTSIILKGMLKEYAFNIFHHLAGNSCPCTDIDHVEIRNTGDFILESKVWGKIITPFQADAQKGVIKPDIPIHKLEHQINFDDPTKSRFRVNNGRILTYYEWYKFMQHGQVPFQELGEWD